MRSVQRIDQYLRLRGGTWYYVRRVPKSIRHVEDKKFINQSLQTDSLTTARQRRDVRVAADNLRWAEITPQRFDTIPRGSTQKDMNQRAEAYGFTYRPADELEDKTDLAELIDRQPMLYEPSQPLAHDKFNY